MRKLLFCLLGFLPAFLNAQNAKPVSGSIEAVTVFLKGATITESTTILLKKGYNNIAVDHLPADIDPARISVQFDNQVDVLSVSASTEDDNSILNKTGFRVLDDSIALLEKLKQGITYKMDALNLELELLKRNLYIGGSNSGVNNMELQKASDFYRLRQDDIYSKLLKERSMSQQTEMMISDINDRRNILFEGYSGLRGVVSIQADSKIGGNVGFKLKYFTQKAAWKPIYDIKVEDVGKPMMLTQKGKILNQTEKDWKNVALVLSTADPSISINRPELEVWALDYNVPISSWKNTANKPKPAEYDKEHKVFQNNSGAYNYNFSTTEPGETTINVSELSNDFTIAEPANIVSSGFPQTIVIKSYTLNCTYEYTGIPKIEAIPYLIGKTTEWRNVPLSDGPASIYIGNNFIGESYIDVANIKDTMEISLGRNKKVAVERNMKVDLTKKSFLGGNITENFTYEISVKNNNNNEIVFELWDQVPVSKQEDIVVSVNEISGAMRDEKTGKLTWRYILKPGEERKVTFSFSVRYPRGRNVHINRSRALRCPDF